MSLRGFNPWRVGDLVRFAQELLAYVARERERVSAVQAAST